MHPTLSAAGRHGTMQSRSRALTPGMYPAPQNTSSRAGMHNSWASTLTTELSDLPPSTDFVAFPRLPLPSNLPSPSLSSPPSLHPLSRLSPCEQLYLLLRAGASTPPSLPGLPRSVTDPHICIRLQHAPGMGLSSAGLSPWPWTSPSRY